MLKATTPANCKNVISVTAHSASDNRDPTFISGFSDSISAPGINVPFYSPSKGQGWDTDDGTSLATPLVASTVAMMALIEPKITVDEARAKMIAMGRRIPATPTPASRLQSALDAGDTMVQLRNEVELTILAKDLDAAHGAGKKNPK